MVFAMFEAVGLSLSSPVILHRILTQAYRVIDVDLFRQLALRVGLNCLKSSGLSHKASAEVHDSSRICLGNEDNKKHQQYWQG